MRPEPNLMVDRFRKQHPKLGASAPGANWGWFEVPFKGSLLRVMSSGMADDRTGWEHVSVSCADRVPTWEEMSHIKALFWSDGETVVQFHPRRDQYVNEMPFCLHLWKRSGTEYQLPQKGLLS